VIADWITSIAGNDPHLMMLLLVLLFTVVGDFIEPVRLIIIFMPLCEHADPGRRHQRRPHGRGADRDTGVRLITPPYGLVLLMASKFVGVSFGKALRAALPIYVVFLATITFTIYFPKVVLWLPKQVIPESVWDVSSRRRTGLYLSELTSAVMPAKGGHPVTRGGELGRRGRGVLDHPLSRMMTANDAAGTPILLPLLITSSRRRGFIGVHAVDDLSSSASSCCLVGVTWPGRSATWCRRSRLAGLRQSPANFRCRRFQFAAGTTLATRPQSCACCAEKVSSAEISAAHGGCRPCRPCDGAAAVRRHADIGVGRREAGVIGGDAEVGDEGQSQAGAGRRSVTLESTIFGIP